MSTAFPSVSNPYTLTPEQMITLSQLPLRAAGATTPTVPVSSYGLTQGTPAVQNTPQSSTQSQLQQALSQALNPSTSSNLSTFVQSLLNNPTAAQQAAGSTSSAYTPQQPSNAWRLNFDGPEGYDSGIGANRNLWTNQ